MPKRKGRSATGKDVQTMGRKRRRSKASKTRREPKVGLSKRSSDGGSTTVRFLEGKNKGTSKVTAGPRTPKPGATTTFKTKAAAAASTVADRKKAKARGRRKNR